MKNYIQDGLLIDVKTDKNKKSGDLFIEGTLVGVAVTDSSASPFTVSTRGVFLLPKADEAFAVGQRVFSKDGVKVTLQDKDATFVGVCVVKAEANERQAPIKIG